MGLEIEIVRSLYISCGYEQVKRQEKRLHAVKSPFSTTNRNIIMMKLINNNLDNRLLPNRHKGFRDCLRVVPESGSLPAAKKYNFHRCLPNG